MFDESQDESRTAGSRENETMDEAHREAPGEPVQPEAGHPAPGEGAGMPEQGAGRAKEQSTPPIGTHDQGGTRPGPRPVSMPGRRRRKTRARTSNAPAEGLSPR